MPSFETFNHLKLELQIDEVEDLKFYTVTLTGDRVKELYAGQDEVKAQQVFDEVQQHYLERVNGVV